jgi:hypothetical protein
MKRFKTLVLCLLLLLFSSSIQAAEFAYSSGILNASGTVVGVPVLLTDLAVYTNGSADATVILYDNTAASGTVIGKCVVAGAAVNGGLFIPIPVKTYNGIYMSITGTGASAIVYWTPE